ncbi:hypothetical protein HGQ17_13930 [Nesterenkonia sp. MY13]|uniref:Uncharacterized protein n=1 Tax=Nesterenkonia sedimenti TaxID=1463632 RepID=A0A7X8TM19_9MICC|nr:hypothetical protein [Nesterenkonia sedimenti]NLS11074.1 hypothetical protein [Nesterenkonia sedimenti]
MGSPSEETLSESNLRRIMIADLDSVAQRDRLNQLTTRAQFEDETLAQIRTSLIISGKLLVTDAMLLDGAFFVHYTPRNLAHALGMAEHQLPLVILSTKDNIRDALESRLENQNFTWQLQVTENHIPEDPWPTPFVQNAWDEWIEP